MLDEKILLDDRLLVLFHLTLQLLRAIYMRDHRAIYSLTEQINGVLAVLEAEVAA